MTAPTPLPWHDQQAAYAAQRAKVRKAVEAACVASGSVTSRAEVGKSPGDPSRAPHGACEGVAA